jgi:diketogulonate reductase-like aldo/keto reductase
MNSTPSPRRTRPTLSPATIAGNMDKDFADAASQAAAPRRAGPFYSAGITENNSTVAEVLSKVRKPENAWLLTWTIQEVFPSLKARPQGAVVSEQAAQEFYINTDDLEAARMGVSPTRSTR